ncbi:hypothetical protein DEO72_LG3g1384 [Vigna unguiculata]|uniref:Transposase (putative) gypsy type domain-containing protein n=1 Tax=Vigna unguiculata TaxID=3917 RepID=A0A4D6LEL2_VIGUN|nr:hypothetical protein DEO72_LG3g1384 [Vigna unguiculata]
MPMEVVREVQEDPPEAVSYTHLDVYKRQRLVVVKVLSQIGVRLDDLAERVQVLEVLQAGCRWRCESTESDRSKDGRLGGEGTSSGVVTSGMPMEVVREVQEDPPEELEESNWPAKGGYGWVAADVCDQSSLFRWSRLLNSWLNCTPVMSRDVSGDIVSLERVSAIDRVCHEQERATEKFFYMYMCHFSQLYVRLPFDDFTMGVLRALNVAPTQLHPNSWAYLQAFRILCKSLYLEPTPYAFLYFYDTRPRRPATWLSLISRPNISRLDAFSQSFKHFKDGYFKVVVKEGGESHFLNADGSTKFPFSWTNNPSRYKDMGVEELSAGDKEVVGMLLGFVDKLPTKGLVRVYNSVHPIIDIEGHMAQSGKKNLALFQSLRKEMAAKAKAAGKANVPNLQESVVEVHVHGGTKRKAELPPRPRKETSADYPVCIPLSVTAIATATIAVTTVWWAAHGLLPLCTPLHTPFVCPPAPPNAPPSMAPTETQHKIQQGETRGQKLDADDIFENLNIDAALYASVMLQPGPKVGRKLQKCHRLLIGFGAAATEAYKAK